MRTVIGLNLGYNSSAVLVDPLFGIRMAISEERLSGEKNTKAFPVRALKKCIEMELQGTDGEINIALCHYERLTWRYFNYIPEFGAFEKSGTESQRDKLIGAANDQDIFAYLEAYIRIACDIPDNIKIRIKRFDHHTCHRLPAYYMSGFQDENQDVISVTSDGFGDGLSLTVYNNNTGETLTSEGLETSLGLMYQYVTGALGYKEHQHEGKITGLAAHGKPYYFSWFEEIIGFDSNTGKLIPYYLMNDETRVNFDGLFDVLQTGTINSNIDGFKKMMLLKETVYETVKILSGPEYEADDADIAASIQYYTEIMIASVVDFALSKERKSMRNKKDFYLTLSGGLFANVKVNYYLANQFAPKGIFVLPPMGDEGTAIGAALAYIIELHGKDIIDNRIFKRDNLYLGQITPDEDDLGDYIHALRSDYKVTHLSELLAHDIDKQYYIAKLLAEGKIVCMSRGFSEFGPRALGNHSILYDASEKSTNDSLNAKLGRTEFMPFAPITIDKFKDDLFLNTAGMDKTLKYMTITTPVTEEFADNYKAACHIDYTARPQILSITDNIILFNIIQHYYNMTGKKCLINTSFNLHNQPIIFTERTALDSFIEADLDVLVINNYIIEKK